MRSRFVSFTLGTGRYCLSVDLVVQILRHENLLPVPRAAGYVEGVINLRGEVVPVVTLRERLGIARCGEIRKPRIIVAQAGGRVYGLAVDEVREIVEIDDATVRDVRSAGLGMNPEYISGLTQRGEELWMILDLPAVFRAGG
jgi:purine-binding chemotaxis protein CheW